jgi:glycosyltransferase involved in cell wall biosynthesis
MKQKSRAHIVQIVTKLELGGAQKVCLALMEGLKKDATLISGSEGVLTNQVQKFKSVYLIDSMKREVGFRAISSEMRTFFSLISLFRKLKKKHSKIIVHTHSTKAGLLGRWAAFFAGVRSKVHTVHGWGFNAYQSWMRWFVIYFLELITSFITTRYVCVSSYDVAEGNRLIPRFKSKHKIIRAAIETEKFLPAQKIVKKSSKEFIFGTVSCFKPQKNLFDLLKAFKRVSENCHLFGRDVVLKIIGDGELRPKIEDWIRDNSLEKSIHLLGWQYDIPSHIYLWDTFVMSSLWEGLPCAVVEARFANLPVVSYNIGGISDVIVDQKNGFLIEPGDWEELARKMEILVEDGITLFSMKMHKDNLFAFDNSFMIRSHKKLYDELL